ncbi:hypothetical protein NEOLEDRAFT_1075039 [Neolentinus lepideus HHB14362 ss-1]|uniref:Uncharacterized protein n=1 Tax=Neolentinus lepideus HHB14362 ss-1 TaxID=1314782 RepID=A0A165P952_9AGAM|nr:hypothetical protein NEOLEDRAFT_1075039 [Neolentinus lepideus HHB14362 ss-1]
MTITGYDTGPKAGLPTTGHPASLSLSAASTPSVTAVTIPPLIISASNAVTLDLHKSNWVEWSDQNDHTLHICSLGGYLDGRISCPDAVADPVGHQNWVTNNEVILGLLGLRAVQEERRIIDAAPDTATAWTNLRARHEQQGPLTQLTLIEEAFATWYTPDERLATTSHNLMELVKRIWVIGIPTEEVFVRIAIIMLNALGDHFRGVCDLLATVLSSSSKDRPLTPAIIRARLDTEQQILDCQKKLDTDKVAGSSLQPVEVLAAQSGTWCTHCKLKNHLIATCWAPSGPMEGKKDEVLTAKRAKRAAHGKGSSLSSSAPSSIGGTAGAVHRVIDGKVYLLDSATGTAFYLAESSDTSSSLTSVALNSAEAPAALHATLIRTDTRRNPRKRDLKCRHNHKANTNALGVRWLRGPG